MQILRLAKSSQGDATQQGTAQTTCAYRGCYLAGGTLRSKVLLKQRALTEDINWLGGTRTQQGTAQTTCTYRGC
jgi:hypothetical protein